MHLCNFASQWSISDVDQRPNTDSLWKFFVTAYNLCIITIVGLIDNYFQHLSRLQINCFSIFQKSSSDFRSFCIQHDTTCLIFSEFKSFSKVIKGLAVSLMVSVRKVQSCHVHSCVKHFAKIFNIPTWRSIK